MKNYKKDNDSKESSSKKTGKIVNISRKAPHEDLYLVVIGASAGGLETLKLLFSNAFLNGNIAFVVITHQSPSHVSILPELLQSYTSLRVQPILKQQIIEPNHIYVLPPGNNLILEAGILKLIPLQKEPEIKFPIDYFLRSLACEKKEKGICVILSGTGTDGTIGLKALRDQGGLVIVQNTQSAKYDGMPKSAINTGLVDYILLPEQIYSFILQYLEHKKDRKFALPDSISEEIKQILGLLNNHTGHDFSLYKPNTIFRRIQKRLSILQISNLSFYIKYLRQMPSELEILFKELLINVTNFFRDDEAFQTLKKIISNKISIQAKGGDYNFRVWIPGCATGEEAYSLAILLQECMEESHFNFNVQMFGTDIDEDAIEIARSGLFSINIEKDISPKRLQRFFIKEGDSYKISIEVRKMIIFAAQNLIKDPPFTKLDILSCRNLLIYLNAQLQKKILPLFHYSLKPQGVLFLGTSETIGGFTDLFTILDRRWKIFERKGGPSCFHSVMDLPAPVHISETPHIKQTEKIMYETEPNISNLVEQMLLKKYTPASVIINEQGTILYIYGRTSRYLEFGQGEVKLNLFEMLRPELKTKVASALRSSNLQQGEISFNALQYKDGKDIYYANLIVRPLKEAEPFHKKLFLILFEDLPTSEPIPEKSGKLGTRDELDKRNAQLEQELKYTKESLQTTIEELETSNEELKSSNEELQSTNEELQSTNEEIETSKEELQSLNEELTTVNAELESRIEQLSSANDDIKNLLDNTEIATVFLDKDLCIKRFTPKATEIINLIPSDVSRPISHIVSNLHYDNLITDSRMVLATLEPKTTEVMDRNGHWYVVRIIPYRTVANVIDGVVITFLNIHSQKKAELEAVCLKDHYDSVLALSHFLLNLVKKPALLLNDKEKITFVNEELVNYLKMPEAELIHASINKTKLGLDKSYLKSLLDTIAVNEHLSNIEFKDPLPGLQSYDLHKYSNALILLILNLKK